MHITLLQRKLSMFVAILIVAGTCGFVIVEEWSFLDSLYMTLITLSTVGFGEVEELTPKGRIFTSALVTVSLVSMACWTAGITSLLVSGELTGRFQKQKEMKMIRAMRGHTVVCGAGVIAITVIRRLCEEGQQVAVITNNDATIKAIKSFAPDVPFIIDDPTSEMALADANTISAKHLVAAVDSDYDNLLITITGRGVGKHLNVISCAQSTELASRMLKVGADKVICPLIIGGEHIASLIETPMDGDPPSAFAMT